jgi:hypothetical protein
MLQTVKEVDSQCMCRGSRVEHHCQSHINKIGECGNIMKNCVQKLDEIMKLKNS